MRKRYETGGGAQTALLIDESGMVGRLYRARTTPHVFVVNKEGVIVYNGAIDDRASADPADIPLAKNYLVKALNELMEAKAVSEPETEPYGCSVKYSS